jgi:hypothetical protein
MGLHGRSLELRVQSPMTLVPRSNPKVSLPNVSSVGTAGASTGYLRFLKTVFICVVERL